MKAVRIGLVILGWLLAVFGMLGLVSSGFCAGIFIFGGDFSNPLGVILLVVLACLGVFLLGRALIRKFRPSADPAEGS